MKECIYRITVNKGKDELNTTFSAIVARNATHFQGASLGGVLQQQFCHGVCEYLTARDIGPVECQQPNHSETDCPDIFS